MKKNIKISVVIACYKDEKAILIMHKRLKETFLKMSLNFQIVFSQEVSFSLNFVFLVKDFIKIDFSHNNCRGKAVFFEFFDKRYV